MSQRSTTLFEEATLALGGTWRLLLGRADAGYHFDFSRRGLAGSFIPLVIANVLLAGFLGTGGQMQGGYSPAMQIFGAGLLTIFRYGAMRLILPQLSALHAFRPFMVASNWSMAIGVFAMLGATFAGAFLAALFLGPGGGNAIVSLILLLWLGLAGAMLAVEINIYRLVVGLKAGEIVMVVMAQFVAMLIGVYVLSVLF